MTAGIDERRKREGPGRSIAVLAAIAVILAGGWVLKVGAGILQPLVIALLLATVLSPIVQMLARLRIPPAFTVVALAAALFFGLVRLGLLLQDNVARFFENPAPTAPVAEPLVFRTPEDWDRIVRRVQRNLADSSLEQTSEMVDALRQVDPSLFFVDENGQPREGPVAWNEISGPLIDALAETKLVRPLQTKATTEVRNVLNPPQPEEPPGGWERVIRDLRKRAERMELWPQLIDYGEKYLRENRDEIEGMATGAIGGGFNFVRTTFLVVLYMLFIFAEQAVFRRKVLAIAGERRDDAERALDTIARGIQRYLGVKTVVSLATGGLCYSVLVWLNIDYAPLWGFLTFLLNYIPTFGSILAGVFPTGYALTMPEHPVKTAVVVAITYLAVNTLLGSYLEPKILGRELNLSPLVIIISVVFWAVLWGPVGAFLAVPLTATAQIVLASIETTRPIAVLLSSGPPREERRRRSQQTAPEQAA